MLAEYEIAPAAYLEWVLLRRRVVGAARHARLVWCCVGRTTSRLPFYFDLRSLKLCDSYEGVAYAIRYVLRVTAASASVTVLC